LPLAQEHDEGTSVTVADRVQLGVQTAFGAPDTSGNRPLFKRLAAVRCAFRCVASIMTRSGLRPLCANAAKILLNTPGGSNEQTDCRSSCADHTQAGRRAN